MLNLAGEKLRLEIELLGKHYLRQAEISMNEYEASLSEKGKGIHLIIAESHLKNAKSQGIDTAEQELRLKRLARLPKYPAR